MTRIRRCRRPRGQRNMTLQLATLVFVLCTSSAQHLPQHRVRRATRSVPYSRSENDAVTEFWIPPQKNSRRNLHETPSITESTSQWDDATNSWFVHGDASLHVSPEHHYQQTKSDSPTFRILQEKEEEETSFALGEKDAGYTAGENVEWNETVNETESTWNVTTEVTDKEDDNATSSIVYTTTSDANTTTPLSLEPIRIRAILSQQENGGQFLSEKQRDTLLQKVLSPAIVAWSAALRVDPVVGNLTVDASQLYDGETCGPGKDSGYPTVAVPLSHLTEGIPDTDIVVFLSLAFRQPPSTLAFSKRQSNNNVTLSFNASSPWLVDSSYGLAEKTTDWPRCSGDYLAAASYCSTDQYDRPTAALLHLCLDESFFWKQSMERDITTVMHELGHALGFNTHSMAHFRRPDGTPITQRANDGNVVDTQVECTGVARRSELLPLPSEEILQFRTVRGIRVAEIVTPSVQQVVRNHFDCALLNGAELETGHVYASNSSEVSDLEAVSSCIGDHWEKRLFRIDLMNPIVDEVPFSLRISPITLALFADSGWYQVDLSRTAFSAAWGRAAGCGFVDDSCVQNGHVPKANTQFFCNKIASTRSDNVVDDIHGCSPDLSRKAACSISQYDEELPLEYQYFNDTLGANVGGSEPLLDYCPVYNGFDNGLCSDSGNRKILQVNSIERFGQKNSRCVTGFVQRQKTALCLPIACVMDDRSLRVNVDGVWEKCRTSGQVLSVDDEDRSKVICPDPVRTCPSFYCHRDCLGTGGVCNYTSAACECSMETENGTVTGTCGELDRERAELEYVFYYDEAGASLDDSSISDYYVRTERALEDQGRLFPIWAIVLVAAAGCSVVGLIVFKAGPAWVRHRSGGGGNNNDDSLWLWRPRDEEDDSDVDEISPDVNKDKFVASMLVDMRVHNGQDERTREASQVESITETECSLTETESSGMCTKASQEQSLEDFDIENDNKSDSDAVAAFNQRSEQIPTSVMRKRRIPETL